MADPRAAENGHMGEAKPLLTYEEVKERTKRISDLISRERELQELLVSLRLSGEKAQFKEQLRRHDEAIAEIRRIRMEGVIPIVRELNDYIAAARSPNP